MMHPIEGLANETVDYISDQVKDNPEIDLKTTINGFALDSISKGLSIPLPNCLNHHNYRSDLPVLFIHSGQKCLLRVKSSWKQG